MKSVIKVGICAATLGLSLSAIACSAGVESGAAQLGEASESEDVAAAEQAWAVVACGRNSTSPNATFTGKIENLSDPNLRHVSPTTYDTCYRSYVVDLSNLSSAYAGPGAGGGGPAYFEIIWNDAVPNNQADCETLWGGAIVYERTGSTWTDLTGQVTSDGHWGQDPWGNWRCYVPAVNFNGAVAGKSYRIAASMRNAAGATRKVGIRTVPPTIIH